MSLSSERQRRLTSERRAAHLAARLQQARDTEILLLTHIMKLKALLTQEQLDAWERLLKSGWTEAARTDP